MTHWSDEAKQVLERALREAGRKAAAEGADANEVAGDIRLRVEQELAARGLAAVASTDVASVLAALGVAVPPADPPVTPAPEPRPAAAKKAGCLPVVGGVLTWLVPLVALCWELFATLGDVGMSCRELFFDPLPTWFHAFLIATVPAVNFAGWRAVRGKPLPSGWRKYLRVMWGLAAATTAWYALRFIVVIPIACIGLIGIIYFGIGLLALLPLSPYFGFAGLLWHRQRFDEPGDQRGKLAGFCAGMALLLALFSGSLVTAHGLRLAQSEKSEEQARGIHLLRQWGDRHALADLCFGRFRGGELGLGADFMNPLQDVKADPEDVQRIFYRAFGEPFYRTATTGKRNGLRGERSRVDVAFDVGQGGDAVGQGLKGLSLAASRLDGQVEPELGSAYLEWTLEFVNAASVDREARAQIALPPGAVVSRLTLWVNGEEREAAFSGKSQVKAAYQAVVAARRDPVLVTSCGEDRVQMQCFPVPRNGGRMKVRLGITAPLELSARGDALLAWPVFLERNFNLLRLAHHDVWIEGAPELRASGIEWIAATNHLGAVALHGSLEPASVCEASAPLQMKRPATAAVLASPDPIDRTGVIVSRVSSRTSAPPSRVVFVIDGSQGLEDTVKKSLSAVPARWPGVEVALVAAARESVAVLDPRPWDDGAREAFGRFVGGLDFIGGQDNAPALVRAWDIAAARPDSVIFWIHGPCAADISSGMTLRQRMERSVAGPRLIDLQMGAGPHRLVETLESLSRYASAGIVSDGAAAVAAWFATRIQGTALEIVRTREAGAPSGAASFDSPHAARLWASSEVRRRLARHIPASTEEAAALAARYFLVTPVSGAVVLETAQQFAQAGLQPMSSGVVTSIVPEPSTIVLAALGIGAIGLRAWVRRRSRRNAE